MTHQEQKRYRKGVHQPLNKHKKQPDSKRNTEEESRHPFCAALSPFHGSNKRSAEETEGEPDDKGGRS